jgi:capsid protein
MNISNQKLINGVQDRYNRKQLQGVSFARDFDTLIGQYDSLKLIGLSRGLYNNNPLVNACINQKSQYAFSGAGEYRSLTSDDVAKPILDSAIKQWSKICEVSGMTFNDLQYLISTKLDIDGDVFVLFTKSKDGYPLLQLIESHCIGSRQDGKIDRGNLWEQKGVLYDKKTKRPIKYRVLGETEKDDILISVRDMMRISEPSSHLRGIPLVSSTINNLYDLNQSQDLLLTQHLLAASISMLETNETGSNQYNLDDDVSSTSSVNMETIDNGGGEVRYFKSGSGGKLEFLNSQNPHIYWQNYQDTLTNSAILALSWHRDLLGMSSGNGVFSRLALHQCNNAVVDRQNLLAPYFARMCNYAIATLITNGYLKLDLPVDWPECKFTKTKSLTVDLARDGKQILEEYKAGIKNLGEILAEGGIDHDEHVLERYREEAKRQILKQQVEKEFGVTINELDARLITPTQYQATTPTP